MTVLTVYNHGTGGSSTKGYDKLEIVNIFSNIHKEYDPNGRNKNWFITEGVGSKNDPASCGPLTIDMHTGRLIEGEIKTSFLSKLGVIEYLSILPFLSKVYAIF